jgi:ATP-dependent DNA ligase
VGPEILFAEQIQGSGVELFKAICARDLEGIVAKHRLGPYAATPVTWFKVLNPDYSQKRGRREMFDRFRERRKPETDSHVLMSLENADEGSAGTRIFIGQKSSSRKHRYRSDIPRLNKT